MGDPIPFGYSGEYLTQRDVYTILSDNQQREYYTTVALQTVNMVLPLIGIFLLTIIMLKLRRRVFTTRQRKPDQGESEYRTIVNFGKKKGYIKLNPNDVDDEDVVIYQPSE